MSEWKFVPLSDLVVWSDNPRHGMQLEEGEEHREEEVINILVDVVTPKKMFNLIKDVFARKGLNGNVVPVAVESGGKYYIYDGNRRISALKLLKRPSIIENADLKRNVEELVGTADVSFVDQVFVYVTNDAEAIELMDRTHSGEQDGVGVIPWEAYQRDISLVRRGKGAMYPAAFTAAKTLGYLKRREFKIPYTDLDRLFSSKTLKDCFGIGQMTDAYSSQIQEAGKYLLQYKSVKRFQSFSRHFNITGTGTSNGPIQQFCDWVKETWKPRPDYVIQVSTSELFANQRFHLDIGKIEVLLPGHFVL
jgi:hypothetical protein